MFELSVLAPPIRGAGDVRYTRVPDEYGHSTEVSGCSVDSTRMFVMPP